MVMLTLIYIYPIVGKKLFKLFDDTCVYFPFSEVATKNVRTDKRLLRFSTKKRQSGNPKRHLKAFIVSSRTDCFCTVTPKAFTLTHSQQDSRVTKFVVYYISQWQSVYIAHYFLLLWHKWDILIYLHVSILATYNFIVKQTKTYETTKQK